MKYNTARQKQVDDETIVRLFIVEESSAYSHEDIRDEFRRRCGCDHDCCGHEQSYITNIRELANDRLAVRTRSYLNI